MGVKCLVEGKVVVLDAATARKGGGLTVAYNLVRRLPNWAHINWQVLASPELARSLQCEHMSNVKLYQTRQTKSDLARHFCRWADIGTLINTTNADAVLYLGNYGFHVGRKPSIVVVQIDLQAADYASNFRTALVRRLMHSRIRYSVSNAEQVVVVSDHIGHQLVSRLGCDRSLIRTVPLCGQIEVPGDKEAAPGYVGKWMPYIFAISGIQDYKNIQVLLDAAHLLKETAAREMRVVIAGVDKMTALRRGFEYDSSVIWAGWIPRSELSHLYSNAEIYVHHSMTESFALPVLEAIQCDTLAIATDVSWARSIYGGVVPTFKANPSDLANMIGYYLDNGDARQEKISRQKIFANRFSWDATAEGLVESVMDVLKQRWNRV